MDRVKRLRKLLTLQEKLKALHETRHAGFIAASTTAAEEAAELAARFDGDSPMTALFPEVYHRRIDMALERRDENNRLAIAEATKLATATVRTNMVERDYRGARRDDERERGDRERLDAIEKLVSGK